MAKRLSVSMASASGLFLLSAVALANVEDIDSVKIEPYLFADFPDSTLAVTDDYPNEVMFEESEFGAGGPFANRHDAWFSSDGGTNRRSFLYNEPFDISVDVTLDVGQDVPRKETGFRIDTLIGGEGLFIVTTNQPGGDPPGEIVSFGGPFPVNNFNDGNLFYNSGDTINLRLIYRPGAGAFQEPKGTFEFVVDILGDGEGPVSSGPLESGNLEGGIIDGSQISMYTQATPADPDNDFSNTTFGNFVVWQGDVNGTSVGDLDCDGDVDFDDIDDFVLGLQDPAAYQAVYGLPADRKGDTDGDFDLDFDDIGGFVDRLSPISAPVSAPEPSTLALVSMAVLVLAACRSVVRPGNDHSPSGR